MLFAQARETARVDFDLGDCLVVLAVEVRFSMAAMAATSATTLLAVANSLAVD